MHSEYDSELNDRQTEALEENVLTETDADTDTDTQTDSEDELAGEADEDTAPVTVGFRQALEDAKAVKAQALVYEDVNGAKKEELYIELALSGTVAQVLKAHRDGCYMSMKKNTCTLRVPLYVTDLKYFYENWEDYYYLPEEDTAIHASVAEFVSRPERKKATPATCYTRKEGRFLRSWEPFEAPVFRRSYKDDAMFFEVTDEIKKDREALTHYAVSVIDHILE